MLDAAMFNDTATGRRGLLLLNETTAPPFGAALFSVTVQVLVAPVARLVGTQLNPLTITGATSETVADFEMPLKVAVIPAVWSLLTARAVAVKFPVDAPAPTVTEPGTVRFVLLLESVT